MCFDNVTKKQSAPSFSKTPIDFSIEELFLREITMWKGSIFPTVTIYQNCTIGFALLNKGAARALDKKYL